MNRFEWLGFFGGILVPTFLIYIDLPFEFGKKVKGGETSVQTAQTFQPSQPSLTLP